MADPVQAIINLLSNMWNSSNTDSIVPKFAKITDYKRLDFNTNQDWILVHRSRPRQDPAGISGLAKNRYDMIDIDVRVFGVNQEAHFYRVEKEVDRILDANISLSDGFNYEYDYTKNRNVGTWAGSNVNSWGGQYDSSGYNHYCGDFNGTDTKVTVADASSIQNVFDGGGTLVLAVKPDDADHVLNKGNPWELTLGDESGGDCKLYFIYRFSGGSEAWVTDNRDIELDAWNFISITYDNSTPGSNVPTIKVNNSTVAITEYSGTTGTRLTDVGSDFVIGNKSTSWYDGQIDELMLFDEVISDARLTALYGKTEYDLTDCKLYYSFENHLVSGSYNILNPDHQRQDLSDKMAHIWRMIIPVQLEIYAKSRT